MLAEGIVNMFTIKKRDHILEQLWNEFADIPMDPETECMEEKFLHFPAGTSRMDIWHWFDERHSKGISWLLYKEDNNKPHLSSIFFYDGVLTPHEYLELMTGFYISLNKPDQLKEVENILNKHYGYGKICNYPLDKAADAMSHNHKVVLVEIVNINDSYKQEKLYRWFQIPEDWTKEEFDERLTKIFN